MNIIENRNLLSDLKIYENILPQLDNCYTTYGSDMLKIFLKSIYTNKQDLLERETLIRTLVSNEFVNTSKNIKNILKQIKKLETDLEMWFNLETAKIHQDLYSKWSILNNSTFLNITNKLKLFNGIIVIIIYILIYLILRYYGMDINFIDYIKGIYAGYLVASQFLISLLLSNELISTYGGHVLATTYLSYQIYSLYSTMNNSYIHYTKCSDFKTTYYNIKQLITYASELNELTKDNCKYINNNRLNIVIDKLNKIFNDEFHLGDMLMIKLTIDTYYPLIKELTECIGTVDAYLSIANLVRTKGYCIPQYEDIGTPFIIAEKLFNPQLDYKNQVKNDITLSDPNAMIITGPNKAGKSTYMKNVMLAIYLAQSIGVSCSETLVYSPFSELFTYLNIPDCTGRESLFEAEINRCFEYYNRLKNLKANEYIFCIIDELFTGTNYHEGLSSSYAITKELTMHKNGLTIISTHFTDLCTLDKIIYKKFIANKDENSKITFPYKIFDGISKQFIAIDLLKEKGYDNTIITTALNKLKLLV
jgi:DNA mismatch repair ATPase MutS